MNERITQQIKSIDQCINTLQAQRKDILMGAEMSMYINKRTEDMAISEEDAVTEITIKKPELPPQNEHTRPQPEKPQYKAVCSDCGTQTSVPFKPTTGWKIRCPSCYAKFKEAK